MKPLLSICIPTYNRADWLRSSLWNWLPQVKEAGDLVELIVSDNGSVDRTKQVVEEAYAWGDFHYHCNVENIGVTNNMYKVVNELAKGEFVWVVGDDDLPRNDTLSRVIKVLQEHPELNYVYVNYTFWLPEKTPSQLLNSSELDFSPAFPRDLQDRFVQRISELVRDDLNCFTPVYCSIWRKEIAISAFKLGVSGDLFSSAETTFPHAVFIVRNLLNQPTWYMGNPCILASLDNSWSNYRPIYVLEYLPALYEMCEKSGVDSSILDVHRRQLMQTTIHCLLQNFQTKGLPMRDKFSYWRFLKRNYRFREFWLAIIWVPGLESLKLLPRPLYELLRSGYRKFLKAQTI